MSDANRPRAASASSASLAKDPPSPDTSHPSEGSPTQAKKKKSFNISKAFKQLLPATKNTEYFHKIFKNVPEDEELIDDYSCALQRDILVQGRLYVSQNYFCFYSNIFGWETMLILKCAEVTGIKKEKTALVFPNAIQILCGDNKYTFSSLLQRETAFRCLYTIWQNALLEEPLNVQQLLSGSTKDWRGLSANGKAKQFAKTGSDAPTSDWDDSAVESDPSKGAMQGTGTISAVEESNVDTVGDPVDDFLNSKSAPELPADEGNATSKSHKRRKAKPKILASPEPKIMENEDGMDDPSDNIQVKSPQTKRSHRKGKGHKPHKPTPETQTEATQSADIIACGCSPDDHSTGKNFLDASVGCSVDVLYNLIFSSNDFFSAFFDTRKTTELDFGEWVPDPATGVKTRDAAYTLALNYSFGPKSTRASEKQFEIIPAEPGRRYIIRTEVYTPNVPFGDNFFSVTRYCLTSQGPGQSWLRISSEIKYRKNQPWALTRKLIEGNSYEGLKKHWDALIIALNEWIQNNPDIEEKFGSSAKDPSGELQTPLIGGPSRAVSVEKQISVQSLGQASAVERASPVMIDGGNSNTLLSVSKDIWIYSLLGIIVFLLLCNLWLLFASGSGSGKEFYHVPSDSGEEMSPRELTDQVRALWSNQLYAAQQLRKGSELLELMAELFKSSSKSLVEGTGT